MKDLGHVHGQGKWVEHLYWHMVDENLVRRDISFAERAVLAHRYCEGSRIEAALVSEVIARLFLSAGRQKRHYITLFALLMAYLEDHLTYPESPPRFGPRR